MADVRSLWPHAYAYRRRYRPALAADRVEHGGVAAPGSRTLVDDANAGGARSAADDSRDAAASHDHAGYTGVRHPERNTVEGIAQCEAGAVRARHPGLQRLACARSDDERSRARA